jgi:hypothetical protein
MVQKINLADEFAKFSDAWKPRIAGDINEMQIKLSNLAASSSSTITRTKTNCFSYLDLK